MKNKAFEFIKNIRKEKRYYDFINQCLTFLIKMSSKTDLGAYFKRRVTSSDGPTAKKKNRNPEIIASTTEHAKKAEIEMKQKSQLLVKVVTLYKNIFVWRLGNMP